MSTATATESCGLLAGKNYFLLRRLHSLTGLLFGGYIIVHLLVNATLVQGTRPDVFQAQVDKIHSLPFLLGIETAFIFLPILFHTVYGIWIVVTGQPNVGHYGYAKNWAYLLQRISAALIVIFLIVHVLGMKGFLGSTLEFDPLKATETTRIHIQSSPLISYLLYPIGILAGTFHLANGFWTAGITWGLTVSAAAQKRWGLVCIGLFLLTFACGMTAWASTMFIK